MRRRCSLSRPFAGPALVARRGAPPRARQFQTLGPLLRLLLIVTRAGENERSLCLSHLKSPLFSVPEESRLPTSRSPPATSSASPSAHSEIRLTGIVGHSA